jgi:hypothetical protein
MFRRDSLAQGALMVRQIRVEYSERRSDGAKGWQKFVAVAHLVGVKGLSLIGFGQ